MILGGGVVDFSVVLGFRCGDMYGYCMVLYCFVGVVGGSVLRGVVAAAWVMIG